MLIPVLLLAAAANAVVSPGPAAAPTPTTRTAAPAGEVFAPRDDRLTWTLDSGWTLTLDPGGKELYPRYQADPRRPRTSLGVVKAFDSEIEEAGETRIDLAIGGRYPLLRISPPDEPDQGFEVSAEAGFFGQFDMEAGLDNIGWDGWYAVHASYAPGGPLRYKLATRHLSAHQGDEYQENTGRKRMNYTREDVSFGVAWLPIAPLTIYGEGSYALSLGNTDLQKKWALQLGAQWEKPGVLWDGRAGYYIGVDSQYFEESDWKPNVKGQVGLTLPLPWSGRNYRIGVEAYTGRAVLGEFSQVDESYISLGFWLDL